MHFFDGGVWYNLVVFVLTISGWIWGFVSYFRSKRVKEMVYHRRSHALIGPGLRELENLQIRYRDHPIQELSLTTVAVWNRGRDKVDFSDTAKTDPLRIQVDAGQRILESLITYSSSEANVFALRPSDDGRTLSIEFDYVGLNEGFTATLFHSGSPTSIVVLGTVKGAGVIHRASPEDANTYAFKVLDATAGKVLPKSWKGREPNLFQKVFVLVPLILLLAVPFLIAMVIDGSIGWMRKPPRQFSLLD